MEVKVLGMGTPTSRRMQATSHTAKELTGVSVTATVGAMATVMEATVATEAMGTAAAGWAVIQATHRAVAAAVRNSSLVGTLTVATPTYMLDVAPSAIPGFTVDATRSVVAQAFTLCTLGRMARATGAVTVHTIEESSIEMSKASTALCPFC